MTINSNNFTSGSLSGAVQVKNSYANVKVGTVPFAFEGDKSFIIRLRRNSSEGDIIATTPTITIKDNAALVSFVANNYSVSEGELVEFTLTTINAANNVLLYYSTEAITANVDPQDFIGSNTGSFLLVDNIGKIILHANVDGSLTNESGETFKLQIRTGSVQGNVVLTSDNVFILDTSNISSYFLSQSTFNVIEGGSIIFDLSTINLPSNTEVYYTTVGNATTQNFSSGNTGSLLITDNFGNINLITSEVIPDGETREFALQIRENSLTGPIKATSNIITIADSSSAFLSAVGGQEFWQDGYKIHVFTSSSNFVVTNLPSESFSENRIVEHLVVAGGGGGGPPVNNEYGNPGAGAGGVILGNLSISSAQFYPVIIGGGSAGGSAPGTVGFTHVKGANSSVFNLVAFGGGGGGYVNQPGNPDAARENITGVTAPFSSGGSGAGVFGSPGPSAIPFSYLGPNVALHGRGTLGQGNPGGFANLSLANSNFRLPRAGSGGGGAGQAGGDSFQVNSNIEGTYAGYGGNGISVPWITPSLGGVSSANFGQAGPGTGRWFGGGGSGAIYNADGPASPFRNFIGPPISIQAGGLGGGGIGGDQNGGGPSSFGAVNTGGGAGGRGQSNQPATNGGSGIVIIRYPYTRSDYNIVESSNTLINGSNIRFTLSTLNVANNSVLYYDTVGNVTTDNFVQGNTGTVTVTVGRFSNIDLKIQNILDNEERQFSLQLRTGSSSGPIVKTSNNILALGNLLAYMNAEGGEIYYDGTYKVHRFYEPGTLQITQGGAWFNRNLEYYIVGGGGSASANTIPYGPVTLGSPGQGAMPDVARRGGGGGGWVHTGTIGVTVQNIPVEVGAGGSVRGLNLTPASPNANGQGNKSNIFLSQYPAPVQPRFNALGGTSGGHAVSPQTGGNSGRNINGSSQPFVSPGLLAGTGAGGITGVFGGNGFVNTWFGSNVFFGGGGMGSDSIDRGPNWIADGNSIVITGVSPLSGASPDRGGTRGIGMPGIRGTGGGGSFSPMTVGLPGDGAPGTVILRYRQPIKNYNNLLENSKIHFNNSNIILTLNTFNVENGTILYYDTVGNVMIDNFLQGNIGTVAVSNNTANIILTSITDNISNTEYRQFYVRVCEDTGYVVSTSNILILAGGL
jgi:hypothetical protein